MTTEYIKIDEKYLLEAGVSPEHLNKMKKEIVQHDHYHYFYDYVGEKEMLIVPVSKIKGLLGTRGDAGHTWWDHITEKAGNLDSCRLQFLRKRMEEKGLEAFRESFENPSYSVQLIYYDHDDCYYVGSDGNHRVTWAKIVNAPYICASVSHYTLSETKRINYEKVQDWQDKLRSLLESYGLQLEDGFIRANGKAILCFDLPRNYNYGNQDQVDAALDEYAKIVSLLEQTIDFHRKLRFIDIRIRKFLLDVLRIFGKDWIVYEILKDLYNAGWNATKGKATD